MEDRKKTTIPFREGLFVEEEDRCFLTGNQCETCGQLFFPPKPYCFRCFNEAMGTVKLGQRGILYSFTTSYMPSEHFDPPYTVGWIDIEKGLRIFSPIKKDDAGNLYIGMAMELVIDELWQEEGKSVTGYQYRPESDKP